ncbi:hypothetical protein Sjap_008410 [Stephania japonica]|uniref:Uncharacterized protein n=1 Tax=Stephania japonica TaxID=461633 RepID=A0AAP0PEF0_9MAGN
MARHGCINGTLDDSCYSSPMPIIGLYIAAGTLVCFLFILFDIISGFRDRKRWLPYRFSSLNSVTLTLLAIAAKIPVDLMTKMPSAHDQLSKLTGTTLICMYGVSHAFSWNILIKPKEKSVDEIKEFLHLIHETEQGLEEWTLRKGVGDMKKWMEPNRNNSAILNINQLKDFGNRNKAYEVTSLSLVLLARIATVCVPHGGILSIVVSEIFEVIHFVERKMSSTSFENKKKSKIAKAASQGPSHRDDLLEIFGISDIVVLQANYGHIDQAMAVVRRLKDALPSDLVREELGILTSFIQQQRFRSVEELHDCIEQLFVEMLNELLRQLPNAIYKEIIECNPEDYEKTKRSKREEEEAPLFIFFIIAFTRRNSHGKTGLDNTRRDGVTLLWDLAEGKKLYSLDAGAIINAKGGIGCARRCRRVSRFGT